MNTQCLIGFEWFIFQNRTYGLPAATFNKCKEYASLLENLFPVQLKVECEAFVTS